MEAGLHPWRGRMWVGTTRALYTPKKNPCYAWKKKEKGASYIGIMDCRPESTRSFLRLVGLIYNDHPHAAS